MKPPGFHASFQLSASQTVEGLKVKKKEEHNTKKEQTK
jgi:hypothetical protein